MANDLNNCNFIGRLGRDPESRTFPSGDMVTNATLAVGSKWRNKQTGEDQESTEWVRLVFNGKLAEVASKYLTKGSQIYVSGQMKTREYEQDGVKKYATEIRVNNMQMLGGKGEGQAPAPRQAPQPQRQAPAPSASRSGFDDDGDIPW